MSEPYPEDYCKKCGERYADTWNPSQKRWCNKCRQWFPDPRFSKEFEEAFRARSEGAKVGWEIRKQKQRREEEG